MSRLVLVCALATIVLLAPARAQAELSDGHVSFGAPAGAGTWYFAEGFTGEGFQVYLLLANPSADLLHARVTHYYDGAGHPVDVTVPPSSRATVDVNRAVGDGKEVALVVVADGPLVAERAVYFRARVGEAGPVAGGHNVLGATSLSTTWFFAEGFTGRGFQEYLTVLNPGEEPAAVQVRFLFPDGSHSERGALVEPRSRSTLDVNVSAGRGREVSAMLTSSHPVVVERPIYFARSGVGRAGYVEGAHAVAGAPRPSTTWHFAEGYSGPGFQQYMTVLNPGSAPARVTATLLEASGSTREEVLDVRSGSRATLDAAALLGANVEASVVVSSDNPVVAERSLYFATHCEAECRVRGGHAAVGVTETSHSWYFAEGYTGSGFREYLTVANPSAETVNVPITFLSSSGERAATSVAIGPRARSTVDVRAAVGPDREVSALLGPTSRPVVAERAMYFSTASRGSPLPGPYADPGQVALEFYQAWKHGDRDSALALARPEAVSLLFALPWRAPGYRLVDCLPAGTEALCAFTSGTSGASGFSLRVRPDAVLGQAVEAVAFDAGSPPGLHPTGLLLSGTASWYGPGFDGRGTASGEVFDQNAMTTAHRTLPFGTVLLVTHHDLSAFVRVNDRGPFSGGRILDLSRGAKDAIGMGDIGYIEAIAFDPAP